MLKVFLSLLILCIAINAGQLTFRIAEHQMSKGKSQLHDLANQFKGIEPLFKNLKKAGYYTDKDIQEPLVIAQFEQAQYVLAPTVLDLNETNHPLVIFDCTTTDVALTKVKELGFQPLKVSSVGLVLALNPNARNL